MIDRIIHTQRLLLSQIHTSGGTQTRAILDDLTVADYAAAMEEGDAFPPVTVYVDGETHWLADGFHRVAAARKVGFTDIDADVRQGTRRDAILHSVGANAIHGLRRTNEDKRRAVETLLRDREWAQWSDREIARRTGTSNNFVSTVRARLSSDDSQPKRKGADGREINVSNIGRAPDSAPAPAAEPSPSVAGSPAPVADTFTPEAHDVSPSHNASPAADPGVQLQRPSGSALPGADDAGACPSSGGGEAGGACDAAREELPDPAVDGSARPLVAGGMPDGPGGSAQAQAAGLPPCIEVVHTAPALPTEPLALARFHFRQAFTALELLDRQQQSNVIEMVRAMIDGVAQDLRASRGPVGEGWG